MTAVTAALLALGVAAQLMAAVGTAVMREPLDRLHYAAPSVLASVAIAAALLSEEGFSLVADKALLLVAVLAIGAPVTVQAVARAVRVDERGDLDAAADDVERLE